MIILFYFFESFNHFSLTSPIFSLKASFSTPKSKISSPIILIASLYTTKFAVNSSAFLA
jgi:hypothetical protein